MQCGFFMGFGAQWFDQGEWLGKVCCDVCFESVGGFGGVAAGEKDEGSAG